MYLHIINALTTKATSNIVQVRKKDYTDGRAVAAAGTAIVNGSRQAVLSPNEAPSHTLCTGGFILTNKMKSATVLPTRPNELCS